ncbi:MAG: hypothetical protein PUD59_02305 [bacterium]|nr:hypothetical protein [bacterium]
MIYIICVPIIIVLLFLIVLIFYDQKLLIDEYNIKITEAISSIDILHDKQIDLLTNISKIINKDLDKKILKNLSKIKNKKLDMFDLQSELHKLNVELKRYIEDNNYNFSKDQDLKKDLDSNSIEIVALVNYYNELINDYNNTISKIKFLFIKMIKKLKKLDVFNIEKDIEFEILKNDN